MQLAEVLRIFDSPLTEEQCWSICYGACRSLNSKRTEDFQRKEQIKYVIDFDSIMLTQRGVIEILNSTQNEGTAQRDSKLILSVGNLVCRCLDYGLDESEIDEVKFNDDLAELIGGMVLQNNDFDEGIVVSDAFAESWEAKRFRSHRNFKALIEVTRACEERMRARGFESQHYESVCKALYIEASELKAFLGYVMNDFVPDLENSTELAKQHLQDWSRLWLRVMNELRKNDAQRYNAYFPDNYVNYDVTLHARPARKKRALRKSNSLPHDAEHRLFRFLDSRGNDTTTVMNNLKQRLSIDGGLVEKISAWDLSSNEGILSSNEEILDEPSDGSVAVSPEFRQKKTLSIDNEQLTQMNRYDSFEYDDDAFAGDDQRYLDELDIQQDDVTEEKIGASLTEILIVRQELTRSEVEMSNNTDLLQKKVCFSCRKAKFSLFQRARMCAVCCQNFCLKCINQNTVVPPHLAESLPANIHVTHGVQSPRVKNNTRSHTSSLSASISDLSWFRKQEAGIRLNTCDDCREFVLSIESERKRKNSWRNVTLQLEL